jgi:hypothetical protein
MIVVVMAVVVDDVLCRAVLTAVCLLWNEWLVAICPMRKVIFQNCSLLHSR